MIFNRNLTKLRQPSRQKEEVPKVATTSTFEYYTTVTEKSDSSAYNETPNRTPKVVLQTRRSKLCLGI